MCGIAGIAGTTASPNALKRDIHLACQALRHRGPDDERHYVDRGIAMGVSRLAIRDLEKGIQPMERQGLIIVFNGELYQTLPLKNRLLGLGYQFETECDTEILLNAFLEYGPAILPELVGMFAFAIWDSKKKRLYLARDRWGEKPLYYTFGEGFLAFASEIKGLRVWPHIEWEVNLEDVNAFLKNSYVPGPATGWHNIFKLQPGSYLVWEEGKLSKKDYFSLQIKEEKQGTLADAEELFQILKQSVIQCAVSDRPVGAFLSGGIDSTTVAYLLSLYKPHAPIFSLYWDDKSYSEEHYIEEASQGLGLNHFSVRCDASFFQNNFESILSLYDEPFADESMVPTYCLASFAKNEVDVVLTGDGADELFHGYERYFFKGDFEEYSNVFAASSTETRQLICNPEFLALDPKKNYSAKSHISEERLRSLVDLKTYLADDILIKVDRACMGVSLEARAPFLTPRVSDFALSCSMQALAGQGVRGKEILRTAMKRHLPKLILERKKMGFGVPLNNWFRTSLKDWMITRLLEGSLLEIGWFSEQGIRELISCHLTHQGNYARTILNLLVLEVWYRSKFVNIGAHQN